ncbi:MAG: methyltransferase domain-containing protein [Pseudomonadota bacterium]
MHMDVTDLRDFYTRPIGSVARRLIQRAVRRAWPDVTGSTLMGLGFATPYLGLFRDEARCVLAPMPAQQGVINWPTRGPFASVLVDEADLPISDGAINHALIVHCLEMTQQPLELLEEVWRVLAPGGRLLAIVPNRRGLWAQRDSTPFGHGRPFSRGQLMRLLKDAMFSARAWETALYVPPSSKGLFLRSSTAWERVGHSMPVMTSGVLLVEATKQVYAVKPTPAAARIGARLPILVPRATPATRGITDRFASTERQPGLRRCSTPRSGA